MAIAGTWKSNNITLPYAGATKWGTGINPVHAQPEQIPRGEIKLPLGSTGPGGVEPESLQGPVAWGYQSEDAQYYAGEDYRYLAEDHPNWGEDDSSGSRPDRDGQIMAEGEYPQPEGWPSWGPHNSEYPDFNRGGPTGGASVRSFSDELELERGRAIAVPTQGSRGGWENKEHGNINDAHISDPRQYEINTSMTQLHSKLDNARAVSRVTDSPRTPITNRLTGVKIKTYAKDINMGGGPGTPDMLPQSQDRIPKRPFFYRTGGAPPMEQHQYNSITYFDPIERTLPDDAGATVTTQESAGGGYGYTPEDGGWF